MKHDLLLRRSVGQRSPSLYLDILNSVYNKYPNQKAITNPERNYLQGPVIFFSHPRFFPEVPKKNPGDGKNPRIGGHYTIYYTILYYNMPYYTIL